MAGIVHNSEDVITKSLSLVPGIVLMNVHMPAIGGLGSTKEVKRINPKGNGTALSDLEGSL